jgi:hypothetical protein
VHAQGERRHQSNPRKKGEQCWELWLGTLIRNFDFELD